MRGNRTTFGSGNNWNDFGQRHGPPSRTRRKSASATLASRKSGGDGGAGRIAQGHPGTVVRTDFGHDAHRRAGSERISRRRIDREADVLHRQDLLVGLTALLERGREHDDRPPRLGPGADRARAGVETLPTSAPDRVARSAAWRQGRRRPAGAGCRRPAPREWRPGRTMRSTRTSPGSGTRRWRGPRRPGSAGRRPRCDAGARRAMIRARMASRVWP